MTSIPLNACVSLTSFLVSLGKCGYDDGFLIGPEQQAKQLKDYENAVIAKRLEELDEDEIQALVEDIERDDF